MFLTKYSGIFSIIFGLLLTCVVDITDESSPAVRRSREADSSRNKRSGSCRLPNFPRFGVYKIIGSSTAPTPGSFVNVDTFLQFSCNSNFILSSACRYVRCEDGNWDDEFPECLQTCPSRTSKTVDFECDLNGMNINCNGPFVEGARIRMKCKEHHRINTFSIYYPDVATCRKGKWSNNILPCEPECGILPKARELIIGGQSTSVDIHPWHVGLYRRKEKAFEYICGGTIINTATIVSAAHCVTDLKTNEVHPVGDYLVAAGKNFRDLDDPNDKASVQKREVSQIMVHPDYRGFTHSYRADLALIRLKNDLVITSYVGLICIDYRFKNSDSVGSTATVVGWGVTEPDGSMGDPLLKELKVPILTIEECEAKVPMGYKSFVSKEKYCAGHFTNKSVCTGDSGSGLITKNEQNHFHTLIGVVSTSPFKDGNCDYMQVATYTKISYYLDFIGQANDRVTGCRVPDFPAFGNYKIIGSTTVPAARSYITETLEYSCQPNYALSTDNKHVRCLNGKWDVEFPECLRTCPNNISKEVDLECFFGGRRRSCDEPFIEGSVIRMQCVEYHKPANTTHAYPGNATCHNGKWDSALITCEPVCGVVEKKRAAADQDTSIKRYPWVIFVYRKFNDDFFEFWCQGTIINRYTIVTTADCVTGFDVHPLEKFLIAAGKEYWRLDDPRENNATVQIRQVKEIIIHPDYEGYGAVIKANIALVRLKDALVVTKSVGVVCMDWRLKYPVPDGAPATFPYRQESDSLNIFETNILSREKCLTVIEAYYQRLVVPNTFCAKFPEDKCHFWKRGTGLITINNLNLHFLTGIASATSDGNCFPIYTNISSHLDFLKQANNWNE